MNQYTSKKLDGGNFQQKTQGNSVRKREEKRNTWKKTMASRYQAA